MLNDVGAVGSVKQMVHFCGQGSKGRMRTNLPKHGAGTNQENVFG